MSNPVHRHFKRAKAFLSLPSDEFQDAQPKHLETPRKAQQLLRILLQSPWNDYSFVRDLDGATLAMRNESSFQLAKIQEISALNFRKGLSILPSVWHPNIAKIYDIYSYDEKIFLVMEHLNISFAQLEFQNHELEEWEIATILAEVLKGVAHVSSLKLSCKDLTKENIFLTLDGEIKLLLDIEKLKYDNLYESPKVSQVVLDFPILAEMIEEMMLSRYHLTSDDKRWSKDALDLLSCAMSGSIESITNHHFLKQAVSPRRLIPRIRFAHEASRASTSSLEGHMQQGFNFDFALLDE